MPEVWEGHDEKLPKLINELSSWNIDIKIEGK